MKVEEIDEKIYKMVENIVRPVIIVEKPSKRKITNKFIEKHFKNNIEVLVEQIKKLKSKEVYLSDIQMGQDMPLKSYFSFLTQTISEGFGEDAKIRMLMKPEPRWIITEEENSNSKDSKDSEVVIEIFKKVSKDLIDILNQ